MEEWDSRPGILQKDRQRKIIKNLLKIQLAKKDVIRVEANSGSVDLSQFKSRPQGQGWAINGGRFLHIQKNIEKKTVIYI